MSKIKSNKKTKWLIGTVLVLIIAAIAGKKAGYYGKVPLEKVAVEQVKLVTITETVLANGKIQPETEVKLAPEISGEIIDLVVAEGDSVRKGMLLAKINPELVQAAFDRLLAGVNNAEANVANSKARLSQSKANFENIRLNFERNQKLFKEKVIAQADFDAIKAQYEAGLGEVEAANQTVKAAEFSLKSAQAGLKEGRENLGRTAIYAPMSGIVSKLNVEKGERVVGTAQMAGTELMRIADLGNMIVQVDVSENDIVRVHIGDSVSIEVDAYPNQKFVGFVKEIANSATTLPGQQLSADQVANFAVKIKIVSNSYQSLLTKNRYPFRPGMSASVEIKTDKVVDAIAVPIQAVAVRNFNSNGELIEADKPTKLLKEQEQNVDSKAKEEKKEVVFVVNNNKIQLQKVVIGIQDDKFIQIKSGLTAGQTVVVAPFSALSKKLKPDLEVQVVPEKELFQNK